MHTDTLAKLTWSLRHDTMPGWAERIGPRSLVIIDEAGMAATTDLAEVIDWVTDRGGTVRLIGDDQQLAAVASGGILRDLAEQAGVVTLSQVMRFRDPAKAPPPSRCAPVTQRPSATTSTSSGCTSATRPPPPPSCSPPGPPTAPPGETASCSPPPATWSPH